MIDRRDFISLSAATALAAAGLASAPLRAAAHIRRYARLSRTELKVSDISFGSASTADHALVRHALSLGINYFDSAESYRGGDSEEAIGEALQGKRQQVYLTSKIKADARDTRSSQMMKALEGSLKRLRADYVDVYFNHAVNDVARMQNPEWREFTDGIQNFERTALLFAGWTSRIFPYLSIAVLKPHGASR